MELHEIQIPDPVTTKSVTFHEYKAIMAVYYMGELRIGRTDAAFLAMTKGIKPPACIRAAFRAWRRSVHKNQLPQTIAKNEAVRSLYAALNDYGSATVNQLVDETGMSKAAINTYLFNLMGDGLVTRTWEDQMYIYTPVLPAEQEAGGIAA